MSKTHRRPPTECHAIKWSSRFAEPTPWAMPRVAVPYNPRDSVSRNPGAFCSLSRSPFRFAFSRWDAENWDTRDLRGDLFHKHVGVVCGHYQHLELLLFQSQFGG